MTYVAGTRKVRDSTYGTGVSTVGAGGSKNKYQLVPVPTVPPEGEGLALSP